MNHETFQRLLVAQFEGALSMLRRATAACPLELWETKIANCSVRWVVYHTLFYTDLYLSPSNDAFTLREMHARGGDEREPVECVGLERDEALAYLEICRAKMFAAIAAETPETLAGPSGFSWYEITRSELHLVSIRHIQHHTGQLTAFLRRNAPQVERETFRWIGSGWRV